MRQMGQIAEQYRLRPPPLISTRIKSRHSLCESLVFSVSLGLTALIFHAFEADKRDVSVTFREAAAALCGFPPFRHAGFTICNLTCAALWIIAVHEHEQGYENE